MFAGNYLAFAALSMLQFNLVANWLVICVLFLFEIKWAFRCSWRASLFCALLVSLVGLGANVFARSLCAIAFDVPQSAFSNDIGEEGNLKTVPVALGFLLGALLLCVQRRVLRHGETAVVYGNDRSRWFVLAMGVLGYLYLCSILLLYYVDVNALVVKAWALKASVSVFASLSLAFYYAYRTAAVIRRSEERRLLEREVAEREHEGDKLQDIVRRDELTGCCSRRFAEARIDELLGRGRPLSLAFVDVNDLKGVNDAGGHEDGDRISRASPPCSTTWRAGPTTCSAAWAATSSWSRSPTCPPPCCASASRRRGTACARRAIPSAARFPCPSAWAWPRRGQGTTRPRSSRGPTPPCTRTSGPVGRRAEGRPPAVRRRLFVMGG